MLNVKLLSCTQNCEQVVAAAAKLCYSSAGVEEIVEGLSPESTVSFLAKLSQLGHESPFEHMSFTFAIEGVSRSLLAQLTRHRIASYSVKSQRYVKEGNFTYITPPAISKLPEASACYQKAMADAQEAYDKLAKLLYEKEYHALIEQGLSEKAAARTAEKTAIEDARFVLPNSCETKIVATFNARSLFNFFHHRCCTRAQWEIRALADEMLRLAKEQAPTVFANCGPQCVSGPCPEGTMSCGKKAEMMKKYKSL